MTKNRSLEKSIVGFIEQSGFDSCSLHEIKAGRNSRVYRVDGVDRQALLKIYHRHPSDLRDRLDAEYSFLELMAGVEPIPVSSPIQRDDRQGFGLYEFLPGEPVTQISIADIDQAAAFITAINKLRTSEAAKRLGLASEACRTIDEHVALVSKRVFRLRNAVISQDASSVSEFVEGNLLPTLSGIISNICSAYDAGVRREPVSDQHWILSPSDFGFHNVLRVDGSLFFVDFEYAGWDDPAKLICDFTCQPELPITAHQAARFSKTVATWLDSLDLMRRAEHLTPLYRLKWCCILLNEYLQEGRDRRFHSNSAQLDFMKLQTAKAKQYFFQHLGSS